MGHKFTSTCLNAEAHRTLAKILASVSPNSELLNDLRSDTTVLVINTGFDTWFESKKFQYVVQHRPDIKVLDYEKVLQGYTDWLKGDGDDDFLFKVTNFPIFQNLTISMSRIEDEDLVRRLTDLIQENGGIVTPALSNTTFAMITEDSHIGRSGKRYAKAKEWEIPVVQPQWCLDCVKRGLLLDRRYYFLGLMRSKDACDWEAVARENKKRSDHLNLTRKRQLGNDDDVSDINEDAEAKVKMNNDDTKEEYDSVTGEKKLKLKMMKSDKDNKIWKLIMNDVKVNRINTHEDDEIKWIDQEIEATVIKPNNNDLNAKRNEFFSIGNKTSLRDELLGGIRFYLVGYTNSEMKILKKVIEQYKGTVVGKEQAKQADYTVMSFQSSVPVSDLLGSTDASIITELAIERSMYYNSLKLNPLDNWNKPITKLNLERLSLSEVDTNDNSLPIKVSITNFKAIELTHLIKILNKFPEKIQFSETFNKSVKLLIVNDTTAPVASSGGLDQYSSDKIKAANAWGIETLPLKKFWNAIS